jgi:hypothetical protein
MGGALTLMNKDFLKNRDSMKVIIEEKKLLGRDKAWNT